MSPNDELRVLAINTQQKRKGDSMNCIYLLRAENICFCLILKEVNSKCPVRCPFFTEGVPGSYQDALERDFDIDCLYCTRKQVPLGNIAEMITFYCTLYKTSYPLCIRCLYAKYKNEP